MKLKIKGMALASLALSPLAYLGIAYGGELVSSLSGEARSYSRASEGERRNVMLVQLTAKFIQEGVGVSTPMHDGVALAPTSYLNSELERAGAKWRVSRISGLTAETFAVS